MVLLINDCFAGSPLDRTWNRHICYHHDNHLLLFQSSCLPLRKLPFRRYDWIVMRVHLQLFLLLLLLVPLWVDSVVSALLPVVAIQSSSYYHSAFAPHALTTTPQCYDPLSDVPSRTKRTTTWGRSRRELSFCLYAKSRTAGRSIDDSDAAADIIRNPSSPESSSPRSLSTPSAGKRPKHNTNSNTSNRVHHRNNSKVNNPSSKMNKRQSSSLSKSQGRRLNQALVEAQSASEILSLLQQSATLEQVGAGKSLSVVNFSTALHRLARHTTTTTKATKAPKLQSRRAAQSLSELHEQVTSDPRTALLLASIAECMVDDPKMEFDTRSLANMAWALAKLKLAPPLSALDRYSNHNSHELLLTTAGTVRQGVMEAGVSSTLLPTVAHRWIPALSQLAGHILDVIGETVLQRATVPATSLSPVQQKQSTQPQAQQSFEMKHWSNLLWAWATAGRADEEVFGVVIRSMIRQQSDNLRQNGLSSKTNPSTMDSPSFAKSLPAEQDWSNAIWAVATAQCYDPHDELLVYLAHLLDEYPDFITKFKSQGISNILWGIATMLSNKELGSARSHDGVSSTAALNITEREHEAALAILRCGFRSLVQRRADGFSPQELSNSLWAAATLGFGLTATSTVVEDQQRNNYIVLKSREPIADAHLMVDVVNVVMGASQPQLSRFSSQELNNLAWALARLVSDDNNQNVKNSSAESMITNVRALLEGIGRQLADPRRVVNSQDVGITLWALATLEFYDKDIYRGIASRLSPDQSHLYNPQHLSNAVWAFATAEAEVGDIDAFDTTLVSGLQHPTMPMDPVTGCFALAADELIRRPYPFNPQDITNMLWAFSKVGIRHPVLFKSVGEHLMGSDDGSRVARGLDKFSSQDLCNMAWAYARQAQLAQARSERMNRSGGNGKLIGYGTIFSDVGEQLIRRLFRAISLTSIRVHHGLRKSKPQAISNTAWAFAVVGLKDTMFMEAAKAALIERSDKFAKGERNAMTIFNGQELANLLWALATVNMSPGNTLEALMPYTRNDDEPLSAINVARQFTRQALANIAWACAVYGNYPDELMSFLYTGLLSPPGESNADPRFTESIHIDEGLQMRDVMTLVYVQASMDLRGCSQNLSLPVNFPDGLSLPVKRDNPMTDDSLELRLHTSKIQRDVSAAFSRIGFEHIEEHTITMAELAENYGIRVPLKQIEIFSIDIANIENKIAIEVDGPMHYVTRIDQVDAGSTTSDYVVYEKVINGRLQYRFEWTGEDQEVNGSTALKQRLLTALGWKVIRIPFWDWDALGGDFSEEGRFCSELLHGCKMTE